MSDQPHPNTNTNAESTEGRNDVAMPAFDDSRVTAAYANFCRVTGTPEEMIIDFGLNPQPIGMPTTPIVVSDRIVVNFFTAKRMLFALQATIQRHEQAFGVLEVDVQKRVKQ